jgi:uncharacterized oligopeptide transporter (OPT) family protein
MDDPRSPLAPYRELTWPAVILGVLQGIVLNLAFVYAALKLGFSIGGSTVAAIMGYALLRGVMKKGTMVENNINQTIASGINTAGTGVVFTVPALFLLSQKWVSEGKAPLEFELLPLAIAGIAGAILGVVVIIPLRKQMIEMDRLRFPTGVAVSTIIRAGSTGADKAKLLAIGILVSVIWKALMISEVVEPSVSVFLTTEDAISAETESILSLIDVNSTVPDTSDEDQEAPVKLTTTDYRSVNRAVIHSTISRIERVGFSEPDAHRINSNNWYERLVEFAQSRERGETNSPSTPPDQPNPRMTLDAGALSPMKRKQVIEESFGDLKFGVSTVTVASLISEPAMAQLDDKVVKARKARHHERVKDARAKLIRFRGYGTIDEEFHYDFGLIPLYFFPVVYLSLMNLAAGMLAGRGGLPFFAGGILAWWVISPAAVNAQWISPDMDAADSIWFIYGKMLRPLGIGTLIGGALMGVVMAFPAIASALRSLSNAAKTAGAGSKVGGDEMSLKTLIGGTVLSLVLFFVASIMTEGVTVPQAILSSVVGTVWLGLAALIVAQATGMTDISPMSGMALISVTLMMFLLGGNIAASMVVGVAVCVAIGQGADMMQDLKTGFMIGARPIRQQVVQFATTWIGALVALGAIYVLWQGGEGGQGGFGPGTALPAPQGGALMGIIDAVKSGNVPTDKYLMGGLVGALLGGAPMSGLGVLVGLAMYLPFSITFGYGLGCLLQMAIQKVKGAEFCEHKLVPICAGLIVGEALTGMAHAFYSIMFPG